MTDTTCPTCGTPCTVGGEGHGPGATRYYVPAWEAEVEELRRQLTRHVDLVNERNAQVSELRRQVSELRRQLEAVAEQAATRLSMLDDMTSQRDQWQRDCEQSQALVAELCSDVWDEQIRVCDLARQLAEAQADQRAAYEEGAAVAQGACREVMIELREARDTIAMLREAVRDGIDWLSNRPDMTEGDIATACRMQAALDAGKEKGNG